MKLECIEDVIMNGTGERAFTKGSIYRGYYYRGRDSAYPYKKVFCAKNDFKQRHCIKSVDSDMDEFFSKHFRELRGDEN